MPHNPIYGFLGRVLLWLPLAFFVWYQAGPVFTWPAASLAHVSMTTIFPEWVATIEQFGRVLDVVTRFPPQGIAGDSAGPGAVLAFEVNPLLYGYSLPLLAALVLAAPGSGRQRLMKLAIGWLILIPFQTWGVCLDILKTLAFDLGPEVSAKVAMTRLERETVALGYQFGTLIFPAVTPVVAWMAMHRNYLWSILPRWMPQ
jgi:hypothetical protein